MTGELTIDLYSDFACPWCFIGTRRLQRVLRDRAPGLTAHVRHHPYMLHPDAPVEGIDVHAMVRQRYGADPAAMFGRVEAAAREEGIDLDLARQPFAWDTAPAHTLVRHAEVLGVQDDLVDLLFAAYFLEGRNISDIDVLIEVAAPVGMSAEQVRAIATDQAELTLTRMEAAEASRSGVSGVPFFVLAGRYALSGAQPEEVFLAAFQQVLDEATAGSAA